MEDAPHDESLAATVSDSPDRPRTPMPRVDLHASTLDDLGHVARYKRGP